jgi:GT2 family glycosyltransferase
MSEELVEEQPVVRVQVVIVNYKTAHLAAACLASLAQEVTDDGSIRVVVVENDSGDEGAIQRAIDDNGWTTWASIIVAPRNGGFSYGNNLGIASVILTPVPPEYFLLLNPDTEVRRGAIGSLIAFMDTHPDVGIAGSSFENSVGVEWPIAFRFPTIVGQLLQGIRSRLVSRILCEHVGAKTMGRQAAQVDWVAGACMMVRRRVFQDIGLMDEGYFLYFEEVDFCLRARRAGWTCWYVPQSRVMHISGQSTGVSASDRTLDRMPTYWFASRSRFFVKNHGLAYARLADLAFGIGRAIWSARQRLLGRQNEDPPGFLGDFWRTSVLFKSRRSVRQWIDGRTLARGSQTT